MPQVFSVGMLYFFIIVMVLCIAWIWLKARTINREAPMDRPVIKVPPVAAKEPDPGAETGPDPVLAMPDELIRQGAYTDALDSLEKLLDNLSPTEDRETRGKVLFRIGACHSRLAAVGDRFEHLLRGGEALREAVRLFTPVRYRNHYLRALGELAGFYDDLAGEKNPVENFTQSARTCETAAAAARQGDLPLPEAMFLTRAGNAYRQLVAHSEPQINLRKAAEAYEKAVAVLETVEDGSTVSGRMKILKILGDTYRDLAKFFQKGESLGHAAGAYESALDIMDETQHLYERCVVMTSSAGVLLELYDMEKSPAFLRQALRHSRDALNAARGSEYMLSKGLAMAVMADALTRYAESKDRRENLERAVVLYETALGIIKDGEEPAERERIRERLAETVQKLSLESG